MGHKDTTTTTPLGQFLAFTADNQAVSVIGEETREERQKILPRVVKPHLSHSYASTFSSCPARLAAERSQTRAFDLFGAGEIGTAAHTVIEKLLQNPARNRTPDEAISIVNWLSTREPESWRDADYREHLEDKDVRTKWLGEVIKAYSGIFSTTGVDPAQIEVVAQELSIQGSHVGKVPVVGYIDLVERIEHPRVGGKVLRITDFKTGKERKPFNGQDDQGDQIREYKIAASNMLDEPVKFGRLLYTSSSVAKQRAVAVSDGPVDKTLRAFEETWEAYQQAGEANRFEMKPSSLCGWCPLLAACEAGQRFKSEYEARKGDGTQMKQAEGLPTVEDLQMTRLDEPKVENSHIGISQGSESQTQVSEAINVTDTKVQVLEMFEGRKFREGKVWDGPVVEGQPNTNSYDAQAVSHLLNLALERANGANVLRAGIQHDLASAYDAIIYKAMVQLVGRFDRGSGLHARMRGFLIAHLERTPEPFGADTQVWRKWMSQMASAVANTAESMVKIMVQETPDFDGWRALASDHAQAAETDVQVAPEEDDAPSFVSRKRASK